MRKDRALGLVAVALSLMGVGAYLRERQADEEKRADATIEAGAARARLQGLEAKAYLTGAGADDVDPASFADFPLYGASEAFEERWGELRRAVRVRISSPDVLASVDAVALTYGSCLDQLGTCSHTVTLVVGPSCRRPPAALAGIVVDEAKPVGAREVLRVDAAKLAPIAYPGAASSVDVLYVGDVVVEIRDGSTYALGPELVPLNAPARAAAAGGVLPDAAPAATPCADA